MKKIDAFSAEKMAIHGVNWHFSVLTFQCAECGPAALHGPAAHFQWHSAEKKELHCIAPEKYSYTRRKVIFFSATAVARTFFNRDITS
jgi:hypothetical protein